MNRISRRHFFGTAGWIAGAGLGSTAAAARAATAASPAVTLACANYVRFMPLATGDLKPKDIMLTWLRGDRSEMLRRATSDAAVDGGEASMAQHLMRLDRGDRSLVGIPVFPLRNFTVRDIYTRKGSALTPAGLAGRRIGIYNWAASGAVWYRHLVRYLGQDPARITWVVGGPDQRASVIVPQPSPPNVTLVPDGKSLADLLMAGDLDAFFAPLPPKQYHPVEGPIVRLVPDFRAVEQRYFKETRCYPPQHLLLLRRETWERDPSIGRRLVDTFQACETAFWADQRLYPYNSPWLVEDIEQTELLMGADYHGHGLEKNRHAVDVFCRSGFEDGLTKRQISVDEFFGEFLRS